MITHPSLHQWLDVQRLSIRWKQSKERVHKRPNSFCIGIHVSVEERLNKMTSENPIFTVHSVDTLVCKRMEGLCVSTQGTDAKILPIDCSHGFEILRFASEDLALSEKTHSKSRRSSLVHGCEPWDERVVAERFQLA